MKFDATALLLLVLAPLLAHASETSPPNSPNSTDSTDSTDPTAIVIISVMLVLLAISGSVYYLFVRPSARYEYLWPSPSPVAMVPVTTEAPPPNYLPVLAVAKQ